MSENANAKKTLSELLAELGSVRSQVAGLEERVVEALSERWVSYDSSLFGYLKDWCAQWHIDELATYSWRSGQIRLEPKLCLGAPAGLGGQYSLAPSESLATLDQAFEGPMGRLLRFASASRELEWDDETGHAVLPFCLIEQPCGFFLMRGRVNEGLFVPENYERVCRSAENLLEKMRRDILAGHFESAKRGAAQVS